MKYLPAPFTGLLITLASLLCPVLMLLALPRARPAREVCSNGHISATTISDANTIDLAA